MIMAQLAHLSLIQRSRNLKLFQLLLLLLYRNLNNNNSRALLLLLLLGGKQIKIPPSPPRPSPTKAESS